MFCMCVGVFFVAYIDPSPFFGATICRYSPGHWETAEIGMGRGGTDPRPRSFHICAFCLFFFVLFFCEVFSDTAVLCRQRETDQLNLLFVCNLDACFCVTVYVRSARFVLHRKVRDEDLRKPVRHGLTSTLFISFKPLLFFSFAFVCSFHVLSRGSDEQKNKNQQTMNKVALAVVVDKPRNGTME